MPLPFQDIIATGNVRKLSKVPAETRELDALILAAGFEERAYAILKRGVFKKDAHCLLIRFRNGVSGNDKVFEEYRGLAEGKFALENIHLVDLFGDKPENLETSLSETISELPRHLRIIAVDISGLPAYAICTALKVAREHRSEEKQLVFYSSAETYNPSYEEFKQLDIEGNDEIELLPRSMALEMSENLILDSFSGYRSQNAKSFLTIFAGFEAHRATGVVEAVNPSLLLLIYGRPGAEELAWRLGLSKKLHRKFERGRRTATEEASTLDVNESLDILNSYYNNVVDDYDMVIAPIGSKMQTVATYLFWERYGEVQLTFPIPIGYDPGNKPRGVGSSYCLELEPLRALFRR